MQQPEQLHHFTCRSSDPGDPIEHPCVVSKEDEPLLPARRWRYDARSGRIVSGSRAAGFTHLSSLVAQRAYGARSSPLQIVEHHDNNPCNNAASNLW
jgi:hypothetical protein